MLIPTPLKYEDLSHNTESNEKNKVDPLCEQVGSLRGVADMLNYGALLLSSESMNKFPKDLPFLLYHGEDDPICSYAASKQFVDGCAATDKTLHPFKVSLLCHSFPRHRTIPERSDHRACCMKFTTRSSPRRQNARRWSASGSSSGRAVSPRPRPPLLHQSPRPPPRLRLILLSFSGEQAVSSQEYKIKTA